MIKKSTIVFLIYDNYIYIKVKEEIDKIRLDNDVIKNGRINNVKKLISCLKKSSIVAKSFLKLVSDSYLMIYFSNYNDYELNNIITSFKDNGIEKIKLVDCKSLLSKDDETIILYNNNYYYVISNNNKYISSSLEGIIMYANSKIIADNNSYQKLSKTMNNSHIYAVDLLPRYLLNKIAKRNF